MKQFTRIAVLPTLLTMIVGTALLSASASAQDNSGNAGTTTTTTTEDQPNYGWVGLLGLAGLAGLLKKPNVVHEVRHDNVSTGPR